MLGFLLVLTIVLCGPFAFRAPKYVYTYRQIPRDAGKTSNINLMSLSYLRGITHNASASLELQLLARSSRDSAYRKAFWDASLAQSPELQFRSMVDSILTKRKLGPTTDGPNKFDGGPASRRNVPWVTYVAIFGTPNEKEKMEQLLVGSLKKDFMNAMFFVEINQKKLLELKVSKAVYAEKETAWETEPPILDHAEEVLAALKRGEYAAPSLWHTIVEFELDCDDIQYPMVRWILSQPQCFDATAKLFYTEMLVDELLQYHDRDECHAHRQDDFDISLMISERWHSGQYVKTDVDQNSKQKRDYDIREKDYDDAEKVILDNGGQLPWRKPNGIFEPSKTIENSSGYIYARPFLNTSGVLRRAKPSRPT